MNSERGISYTKLLIIFAVVIVIGIVITNLVMGLFKEEKLEDIKTNMLLVQTKVKVIKGDCDVTGDAAVLKGQKLSDPEKPAEITEFLNKGIILQEEYDYYYILNQDTLNQMGLGKVKLQSGSYFIVNYTNYEVVYTNGYTDEYKNTYYKLSEINDLSI